MTTIISIPATEILTTATMGYRQEVLERATHYASDYVARVTRNLELHGNDLNAVAPLPTSEMDRAEYAEKKNARRNIKLLVDRVAARRRKGAPCIVSVNPAKAERYIAQSRAAAIASVEAFIARLAGKVGDIVQAVSDGAPVWHGSVLTVVKPDGTIERWRTEMIVNVSALGKLFNQWLTRRIK